MDPSSHTRPGGRQTLGVLGGLCLALTVAAADTKSDAECRLEPVQAWPVCSPEGMRAAINPPYTLDFVGNLNPAAFAGGANRELLPGQAKLVISGAVSAGGAACARHLAAAPEKGASSAPAFSPAMAKRIKQLTGKDVPSSDKLEQHVVFQIFSPNLMAWESGGGLGDWYTVKHDGVGGWPNNSAATLNIELPGTRPSDLEAGGSYTARVYGDSETGEAYTPGEWFTRWQGRFQTFPYRLPTKGTASAMERSRKNIQRAKDDCRRAKQSLLEMVENSIIPMDSTIGRAARERDCNVRSGGPLQSGDPYLVGRIEEASDPELTGTVTISHITDSKVIGSFELSGKARVIQREYELCYANANNSGCSRDGTGPANGTAETRPSAEAKRRSIRISGRFHAPNRHSQGFVAPGRLRAVTANPDGTSSTEPLEVVSHTPRRNKRNVDWENPGIRVRFSAPVDPTSVDVSRFKLTYRNQYGTRETVPGDFAATGPDEIRFIPDDELKDGVRYNVKLETGIEGRDGQPLAGPYDWPFSTMVDLDDDQPIALLPDILNREEGIEPHVFQVSRDAPLVPGKPTLTRVYAKWAIREDVFPDDQVQSFDAHVRIKDDNDRLVYPPKHDVRLRRHDDYTDREILNARNSANLLAGWRARSPQPATLVAEIEPADQCAPARTFESDPHPVEYSNRSPVLDVDVYLFKRAWAEDAYQGRAGRMQQQLVETIGPRIAQYGAAFTTQNFPVIDTRMHFKGPISASLGFAARRQGNVHQSNPLFTEGSADPKLVDEVAIGQIRDQLAAQGGTDSDVVMILFPAGIRDLGGYTYDHFPDTGLIGIFVDPDTAQYFPKAVNDVAHEIGHVYGLNHSPRKLQGPDLEADTQGVPPIEGFRLTRDGAGWNKSEEEGNAQSQSGKGTMMALMAEGQFHVDGSFISQAAYEKLVATFRTATAPRLRPRRLLLASAGQTLPAAGAWRVSGALKPDGSAALINRVTALPGWTAETSDAGPFRAVLLDAEGREIAARRFAAPSRPAWAGYDDQTPRTFRLHLPGLAQPAKLIIEHKGNVLAERTRTAAAPTLELDPPTHFGDRTIFTWQAEDADSDTLVFDLEYSRDGERFRPLALGLTASELTLPTPDLYPGPRPTVRVTATDGFNQTRVTRRLERTGGLRVLAHGPGAEHGASLRPRVYALFNVPLAPDSAESVDFVLTDVFGEAVATSVEYEPGTRQLALIPETDLIPGGRYTARLSDVHDTQGNALNEPVTWDLVARETNTTSKETQ